MLSVGEILKKERERQGILLIQVEKNIKVRVRLLKAIEDNNWENFTSKIYITGIIKNYSQFLNLDPQKILAFFRRDYERIEEVKFKKRVSSKYLTSETRNAVFIGLAVLFTVFFVYFGYQLKQYFTPPKVEILLPRQDKFNREDRIKIVGKTDKDVMINIFGDRIYQNKEGIFEYEFPLHSGKNELVIEVTGANGKKTILKKIYSK